MVSSMFSDVTINIAEWKKEILSLFTNDPEETYSNSVDFQRIRICTYVEDHLITQKAFKLF